MKRPHALSLILPILSISMTSMVYAASLLDDDHLSKQTDGLAKVLPPIVVQVQKDVTKPIDEQNKAHDIVSNQLMKEMRERNIQSGVLSTHEQYKKSKETSEPKKEAYLIPVNSSEQQDKFGTFRLQNPNINGEVIITVK